MNRNDIDRLEEREEGFENSGEMFRTQADCQRKTSVAQSALSACLNGKATHYKNMRFRYVYLKE